MEEKEISVKEIQASCLLILKDVDQFIKEHGLTYYMSGGTLLGAVRHKGFIPWDDDIDLMMPRPDYERFIKEYNGKYKVSACTNDREYMTPSVRVWDPSTRIVWTSMNEKELGIFIDIFPMDGYPSGEFASNMHIRRLFTVRRLIRLALHKHKKGDRFYKAKTFVQKLLNANRLSRKLNRIAMKCDFSKSDFAGVTTTLDHLKRERNSKEIYKETVYLPFEDMMLPAPVGYDTYLTKLYGDYMQLPPPEKRVSEHNFILYRR